MTTTNLSAEVMRITPELAKNFLRFNRKNRKVSERQIRFLTQEMKEGRFIENGESVIFDKYGELKDGQHRLLSIIRSGKSFNIPVIRGVDPIAMATYDTGKNRSASDVLTLNGFKNSTYIASFIKLVHKYIKKGSKVSKSNSGTREEILTNQQVLEYCSDNYYWIDELYRKTNKIYEKQNIRVISVTNLMLIAYIIGGEKPDPEVYDFLNHLVGNSKEQGTATSYLYSKLSNAKLNKEPLNFYWVLGMTMKAWNYYADGNPAVKYFKFSVEQVLPKPLQTINF